ncbi:hypothetical protein H4217_007782, partial [Coemansia sp. RSA 1939]
PGAPAPREQGGCGVRGAAHGCGLWHPARQRPAVRRDAGRCAGGAACRLGAAQSGHTAGGAALAPVSGPAHWCQQL